MENNFLFYTLVLFTIVGFLVFNWIIWILLRKKRRDGALAIVTPLSTLLLGLIWVIVALAGYS